MQEAQASCEGGTIPSLKGPYPPLSRPSLSLDLYDRFSQIKHQSVPTTSGPIRDENDMDTDAEMLDVSVGLGDPLANRAGLVSVSNPAPKTATRDLGIEEDRAKGDRKRGPNDSSTGDTVPKKALSGNICDDSELTKDASTLRPSPFVVSDATSFINTYRYHNRDVPFLCYGPNFTGLGILSNTSPTY